MADYCVVGPASATKRYDVLYDWDQAQIFLRVRVWIIGNARIENRGKVSVMHGFESTD